jgi:hypothetical protein
MRQAMKHRLCSSTAHLDTGLEFLQLNGIEVMILAVRDD